MSDETSRVLRSLGHPLRRGILKVIFEHDGQGIGPREVAAQLGESLSNVSYHVRILVASGLITLERTEPARGSMAHFYVCTPAAIANPIVRTTLGLSEDDS